MHKLSSTLRPVLAFDPRSRGHDQGTYTGSVKQPGVLMSTALLVRM